MTNKTELFSELRDVLARRLDVDDEPGTPPYVLTDFVIVAAQQRVDDNADVHTAIGIVVGDGSTSPQSAIGLIEYARARLLFPGVTDIDDEDD